MKTPLLKVALSLLLMCGAAFAAAPAAPADCACSPRERLLMDFGWKFHLGDDWGTADNLTKADSSTGPAGLSYSDASWRTVDLPHDWAIELPFDAKGDCGHGFKARDRASREQRRLVPADLRPAQGGRGQAHLA